MAEGKLRSHGGERSHRGAEGKAERFPHGGAVPTSTHQPERLFCSAAGAGWGWELRLGLQRSDPMERTGVGGVNTDGKRSGAAEEARDVFLPLYFLVRKERGFRALLKGAPETGASCGYQRGPQRRAWDAKAAAAATKKPVSKHRSLSIPPLPGACAARHCQGPVVQGQLPQENARRPLPLQAHPASSVPLPPPGLSEPEPPKQLLL